MSFCCVFQVLYISMTDLFFTEKHVLPPMAKVYIYYQTVLIKPQAAGSWTWHPVHLSGPRVTGRMVDSPTAPRGRLGFEWKAMYTCKRGRVKFIDLQSSLPATKQVWQMLDIPAYRVPTLSQPLGPPQPSGALCRFEISKCLTYWILRSSRHHCRIKTWKSGRCGGSEIYGNIPEA